jgi:membrane-bound lytic murein transglycosylase B
MNTPRPDADTMWSSPAPTPATPAPALGTPAAPPAYAPPAFTTARRGFDQRQVLEHVAALTTRLRSYEDQVRRLRTANDQVTQQRDATIRERDTLLRERARQPEPYEQVSARVAEVLASLDRDVDRIKAEATVEGELIVANARTEAELLRHEVESSHTDAARSLAELRGRREEMLEQLRRTCGDFMGVIQSLAASIEEPSRDRGSVVVPDVAEDRPA